MGTQVKLASQFRISDRISTDENSLFGEVRRSLHSISGPHAENEMYKSCCDLKIKSEDLNPILWSPDRA